MIESQVAAPMSITEEQALLLQKLERAVEREQRIAGYPKLKRHMVYSEVIKSLVIDLFNSGVSLEAIAEWGKISSTSVAAWCAAPSRQFKELSIIAETPALDTAKKPHLLGGASRCRSIKRLFPSGVSMRISREDLDETLLKTLMTCGG